MVNTSLLPICLKCGAQCCKRKGSPMVLPEEREKIIKHTGKNAFKKEGNYYIIPKSPCPFLTKDDKCSIHSIRPFDCKIYPCNIIKKKDKFKIGISQICPAKMFVDKQFILDTKKIINKLTPQQKEDLYKLNLKDKWGFVEYNRPYGQELILDLYGCDVSLFTKTNINRFFTDICKKINMKKHGKPVFWHDDSKIPHLKGTSAMQFITTSNIVVHALDILGVVYISIFSCKKFDKDKAAKFSKQFFRAEKVIARNLERK